MEIRRLQTADASAYRALRLRGLHEHPDAFTSSFEEESLRPLADAEKRLSATAHEKFWGAFVNGVLAGMVGLNQETRLKNRHKATLVAMYVADEFTGQGLGRALVDNVLQDARTSGIEHLILTVTDGNRQALALYERAGFTSFGTEPDAIRVNGISFGKTHMYLHLKSS
ncbi:GNAT family N-acetyltransferase [Polaromonas jejuensis]|uniref:GNAT family N-acetyltransferase n=1 Tax=Polaromonas jejuensis TaxID=457502 RepID=A0ABW0Q7G8_9BURK|nr:GNAT family N-acetyltransferase [Polaromonas jejuensis]